MALLCGDCGAPLILRFTTKFPNKDGSPRKFFGCTRYPDCKGVHSAHQNSGKPMGIPADRETIEWRKKAHQKFDPFVEENFKNRRQGYRFLQDAMDLSPQQGHISRFDIEQCKRLLGIIKGYKHAKTIQK